MTLLYNWVIQLLTVLLEYVDSYKVYLFGLFDCSIRVFHFIRVR